MKKKTSSLVRIMVTIHTPKAIVPWHPQIRCPPAAETYKYSERKVPVQQTKLPCHSRILPRVRDEQSINLHVNK